MPISTKSHNEKSKYLIFELAGKSEQKPKTQVYNVLTKNEYVVDSAINKQHIILGQVLYFAQWRQYLFQADNYPYLANSCLKDIIAFVDAVNLHHRTKD